MMSHHVFVLFLLPAVAFCAPLSSEDEYESGNGIDEEVILSVSTIVNGVNKAEVKMILAELDALGDDIRQEAFEAFRSEVAGNAMTVEDTRSAVEVIKMIMDTNLSALNQIMEKVEWIASSSPYSGLTEHESIFLSNVRNSIPDILDFTRQQFRWATRQAEEDSQSEDYAEKQLD